MRNVRMKVSIARALAAVMMALAMGIVGGVQAAQRSSTLPEGEYDCGGGYTYRAMGKVDIKGSQFRYRPFGEVVNAFAPYTIDAGGEIRWGGPFGGLDDAPAKIVTSTREAWGFNINYQGSADGLVNTMSCHAPGQ